MGIRTLSGWSSAALLAACLAAGCGGSGDGDSGVPAWDVEVAVTSAANLGALQLRLTHLGASGAFLGTGDQVDCVPLVDALMASNFPGGRTVQIGLIDLRGFRTPASVVRCGFVTTEALAPDSFLVEVVDASGAEIDPRPLDPPPTVAVVSVTPR